MKQPSGNGVNTSDVPTLRCEACCNRVAIRSTIHLTSSNTGFARNCAQNNEAEISIRCHCGWFGKGIYLIDFLRVVAALTQFIHKGFPKGGMSAECFVASFQIPQVLIFFHSYFQEMPPKSTRIVPGIHLVPDHVFDRLRHVRSHLIPDNVVPASTVRPQIGRVFIILAWLAGLSSFTLSI